MTIDYRVGDTRQLVAELPDASVDLVASSPPFIALRSYLPADHPDKAAEIGGEPDPATFLDTLLGLTAEWFRVLSPWGSIAIELGDTYAATRNTENTDRYRGYSGGNRCFDTSGSDGGGIKAGGGPGWPRAKSLALIPQLYATSLAYGRNMLTGQPAPFGPVLVRNVIVWHRPNPAVGALGDKFRPSTSYITVATRDPRRWFDLTAVRTPYKVPDHPQVGKPTSYRPGMSGEGYGAEGRGVGRIRTQDPAGAPPLDAWFDHDDHDLWNLTTQPSRLAHYAMWPAKLAERLILSMCPAEVCQTCGEPRRRVERASDDYAQHLGKSWADKSEARTKASTTARNSHSGQPAGAHIVAAERLTLGWTDCGHDAYRPGRVLDPFAGTGTTLAVAHLHQRDGIGFDLDQRNHDLYPARLDECRKALFGTQPELPGQLTLLGDGA